MPTVQKREVRKPAPPTTPDKNPTLSDLMSQPGPRVKVRFGLVTKATQVRHDPITLNTVVFQPGQVYELHPIVAEELQRSIALSEMSPIKQMTGNTNTGPAILKDLAEQARFEREQIEQTARDAVQGAL